MSDKLTEKKMAEVRETVETIGKRLYDSIEGASKDHAVRGGWLYRLWMMTERDVIRPLLSTPNHDAMREALDGLVKWHTVSSDPKLYRRLDELISKAQAALSSTPNSDAEAGRERIAVIPLDDGRVICGYDSHSVMWKEADGTERFSWYERNLDGDGWVVARNVEEAIARLTSLRSEKAP